MDPSKINVGKAANALAYRMANFGNKSFNPPTMERQQLMKHAGIVVAYAQFFRNDTKCMILHIWNFLVLFVEYESEM